MALRYCEGIGETPMPALSKHKHELFAHALVSGLSASAAYVAAGYAANDGNAARLKGNERVTARISELQDSAAEKAVVTRRWVLERLIENVNRSMQAVEVKKADGDGTGEYRYEGSVANRALELLGKELGMFVERRKDTSTNYVVSDKPMSIDEWEAKYCLAAPGGLVESTR